jgi:hypothetical protein
MIAFNASQPRAISASQAEFEAWISPLSSQAMGITQGTPPQIAISLYLPSYSPETQKGKIDISTKHLSFSKVVRLLELSSESKIVSQTAENLPTSVIQANGEYLVKIDGPNKTYLGTFENSDLNENVPLRNFLLLIQEYANESSKVAS